MDEVKRLLSQRFYRREAAVEKENYVNLFFSPSGRLPLGKITYFKDVIILFDGLDEIICHENRKLFINIGICSGKLLLPSSF